MNNTYNHLADYRFTFDEILNGYEPEVKVGAMYNLTYDYNGHVGEKTVVAIESGIDTSAFATKEELEGYALKEKWEKIAELTVEPDSDGALPSSVLFTLDKNGNPFKLTKLKAIVETNSLEENGGAYASATLNLNVAQQQDIATTRALYITGLPTTVNKYSRAIFDAYVFADGKVYVQGATRPVMKNYSVGEIGDPVTTYSNMGAKLITEYIEAMSISGGAAFHSGTKITIWGVRANENT